MMMIAQYISMLLLMHIFISCYSLLTDKNINYNLKYILIILIATALFMLNNLYTFNILRIFISYFIYCLVIKIIYDDDAKNIWYYCLIIYIIGVFIELIVSFSLLFVGQDTIDQLNKQLIIKFVFTIVVCLIEYFIFKKSNTLKIYIEKLKESVFNNYNLDVLLYTILIISNVVIVIFGFNYDSVSLYFFLSLIIIIMTILIVIIIVNVKAKKDLDRYNKNLLSNIEEYENVANEYRELRHNLLNDLLAIKCKVPNEEGKYIDVIINKYQKNLSWISNISNMPKGIKGLIYYKLNANKKLKIKYGVNSNISDEYFTKLKPNKYHQLCTIIGILLDNAICAANESLEKCVYINFTSDKKMIITNTFSNTFDITKYGTKNYSTKEQKSGLGVYLVRKRYNKKYHLEQKIISNIFITTIDI